MKSPGTHNSVADDNIVDRNLAVGIVANEQNTDGVIRTILRAQERGCGVIVTYRRRGDIEAVRFANRLGAIIIEPSVPNPDTKDLRRSIKSHARELEFSGLVFQQEDCSRIDFPSSERQFEVGDFSVAAISEQSTEQEEEQLLVGIPAYNEADAISNVVQQALEYGDSVVVVDDGSKDRTSNAAREAGAIVVKHDTNRGYGASLKTLFKEAKRRNVDTLVVVDGDRQHDPAEIPCMVNHLRTTGAEIVIGSRFADDGQTDAPLYRRFGLGIINKLTNLSLGILRPRSWITDTQSGFRAYNRRAIKHLATAETISDGMGASVDILFHASYQDLTVKEIGAEISYDQDDINTHNPVRHGLIILRNIIRTVETKRPITAFGVPSFLIILFSTLFSYWTIVNYVNTGSFPYGLAIVSGFSLLVGIFSGFTAIILHALRLYSN
jgi:glycosyltransferase involved in cell wall biosynthesis